MARLPVIIAPDTRLASKARPVDMVDDPIRRLMDDMLETMYASAAIGLAAPQVGAAIRVLVIDVAADGETRQPLCMANPEMLWVSREEVICEESCLSVPGQSAKLRRKARLRVRFLDRDSQSREIEADGLLAMAIQHEMDHLEGVLFIDRLPFFKRPPVRRQPAAAAAMNPLSRRLMRTWIGLGPRFLPFADAATPDLPLSRLLRLSLFQVSVGMALVLLIGTLNRVMIVELGVPASLVGVMISLPLLFAPFRAVIGFRSDTHQSVLGWKRVPFIWKGTLVQFGGLAIMPFALLVLSGAGHAGSAPVWLGHLGAAVAFLLVGAGLHTIQTVGLALATDLAPEESQPKVVGLMYVMLLFGMIASALIFGAALADFSPGRLVQVIQGSAVATMVLNIVALWKQETRNPSATLPSQRPPPPPFRQSWERFCSGGQAIRRLTAVGLGTMGFSMEDVLLEPYGGQILHLSVGDTTRLTATLAIGGLLGFGLASRVLSRGADPFRMAIYGTLVGIPAFFAVIFAAPAASQWLFAIGTLLIGLGGGLFGHGTLTATMTQAPDNQRGLALGAWGAVQASAAGLGVACGGIIRDVFAGMTTEPAFGYIAVYGLEITLLAATLIAMRPLVGPAARLRDGRVRTEPHPQAGV